MRTRKRRAAYPHLSECQSISLVKSPAASGKARRRSSRSSPAETHGSFLAWRRLPAGIPAWQTAEENILFPGHDCGYGAKLCPAPRVPGARHPARPCAAAGSGHRPLPVLAAREQAGLHQSAVHLHDGVPPGTTGSKTDGTGEKAPPPRPSPDMGSAQAHFAPSAQGRGHFRG